MSHALFAVVGDPIHQSLSPLIHNSWMRRASLPAEYRGILIKTGEFAAGMRTLESQGIQGLNITAPHKHAALEYCDKLSPEAARIGAVNTMLRDEDGAWMGLNTDKPGFIRSLSRIGIEDIKGRHVLVLGAGGAARAVVAALVETGAQVRIANRTLEKAQALAESFGVPTTNCLSFDHGLAALGASDLVINTTSLGHKGEFEYQWPDGTGRMLYDISYGKAAGAFLTPAYEAGWQTEDGLGMLVGQAAVAFEAWFDITPDAALAYGLCRKALEAVGA